MRVKKQYPVAKRRYDKSEKGKARRKRCLESPQGRERTRRRGRTRQLDPEYRRKEQCRLLARKARADGVLVPKPCERCGSIDVQMHHDDYDKPLEVRWLCELCHKRMHNPPIDLNRPEDNGEHERGLAAPPPGSGHLPEDSH